MYSHIRLCWSLRCGGWRRVGVGGHTPRESNMCTLYMNGIHGCKTERTHTHSRTLENIEITKSNIAQPLLGCALWWPPARWRVASRPSDFAHNTYKLMLNERTRTQTHTHAHTHTQAHTLERTENKCGSARLRLAGLAAPGGFLKLPKQIFCHVCAHVRGRL